MQKKIAIFALVAITSFGAILGVVSAHQWEKQGGEDTYIIHEELMSVMDSGTYADFVALHEKYDGNFMAWIENEEDFALMQQMHERMEEYHESTEFGGMRGMHGSGMGMHEGCPMMRGL